MFIVCVRFFQVRFNLAAYNEKNVRMKEVSLWITIILNSR